MCSPVRNAQSAHISEKQRTPLSHVHRFVHSGVQLLANTPGKHLCTPEYGSGTQLMKDGRTQFLTPLSIDSNIQVGATRRPATQIYSVIVILSVIVGDMSNICF